MWQVRQPWCCSDDGDKFGMEEKEPVDLKLHSFLNLLWAAKTTTVKSRNVLLMIPLGRWQKSVSEFYLWRVSWEKRWNSKMAFFHRWEARDELSPQSWKKNDKPQKLEEGEQGFSRLRKWNAEVLWHQLTSVMWHLGNYLGYDGIR